MPTSAELVTYSVSVADIAATKAKYAVLSCDTPAGYESVRLAIAEVRDTRVAIEKRRVELKADALAYGRLVDSEAKRYTGLLLEIEEPLKAKKAAVDDEKARLKAEAEAVKLRALEEEIARNRAAQEAEARAVREAEEKRLAEERERLAAERAEFEAKQRVENDRIEAARRIEQARLDEAARVERARIDAEREKLAQERRAEEARQKAERDAIGAERKRVAAEREKAERDEFERQAKIKAAEAAEQKRLDDARRAAELAEMLPDVEKLAAFAVAIRALKAPTVKSDEVREVFERATGELTRTAGRVESMVEEFRRE